jgi:hypothetical protein
MTPREVPSPQSPPPPQSVHIAVALVRGWTRIYTWGMPRPLRDARRAEIESDLWEFQDDSTSAAHDRTGLSPAAHIVMRLLLGMPHDLFWRVEHVDARDLVSARAVVISVLGAATVAIVMAALWVLPLMLPQVLPTPPARMAFVALPPPPPPPPPPPAPKCRPPALTTGCSP